MKTRIPLLLALTLLALPACKQEVQEQQSPQALSPHEWAKDAIIYEVNVRQYTPEGTFDAFRAHLPRLSAMGVDILWLMPVHPIGIENRKGSLGSYYSIRDYKGVNEEYGSLEDLRELVDEAHALGMKVILDWVANHSSWDNVWVAGHPDFYERDGAGQFISPYDWTDVISFDYSNPEMRDSMISALKYWLRYADVDGYRCDVAGMVPTDFWEAARVEMEKVKPVFMLAEDEDATDLMVSAFDMNYAWKGHHHFNKMAKGEETAADMRAYLEWDRKQFPPRVYRMNFLTNHDENSWNGTIAERLGEASGVFAVLAWTLPDMPLIYSGEEAGLNKRLRFFDKDTISWESLELMEFYKQLAALRTDNPALHGSVYGGEVAFIGDTLQEHILAFTRSRDDNSVACILNLSAEARSFDLAGSGLEGRFTDHFSGQQVEIASLGPVELAPWSYLVLVKK